MSDAFINPIGRAFSVLSTFNPHERWLSAADIAARTALPISTVTRILKSLTNLQYVYYCTQQHKYRLTALVLTLGYAAIAHSNDQASLLPLMREIAEQHGLYVVLGTRDRLDIVLLECVAPGMGQLGRSDFRLRISVGSRLEIGGSPLGWALLASLPEIERSYLTMKIEQKKSRDWPRIKRKLIDAENFVRQHGYCMSLGEIDPDISIVAAPLEMSHQGPMVIACLGESKNMSRSRVEREIGPLLARIEAQSRRRGQIA